MGHPLCVFVPVMSSSTFFNDRRTAVMVYLWLMGLTLLEVGIVLIGLPKNAGVALVLGTTLGKILLIVSIPLIIIGMAVRYGWKRYQSDGQRGEV